MPSANLDLVRSIYAAWERGDFSSADWADPKIEFVITGGPAPGSWIGLTAMTEAWREMLGAWEDYRTEVDEYRELDRDRVLVHFSGHGKSSGFEARQFTTTKGGANLLNLRGGKVTRFVIYWDRERALADLGLGPEADAAGSPGLSGLNAESAAPRS
jgi:ketosteroid isomerase-like protein